MRTILLEVSPLLNGVPVSLRLSGSASSSATTQLNGYQWLPCITKRHTRSANWAKDGVLSTIDTSWGAIEFWLSKDFNNETWTAYEWSGAQARIFIGEEGKPFASYTQQFEGNVSSLDRTGNKATIALLGSESNLTIPLLNLTYGGTGGADGMVSMKGQLKPRAFGSCKTVAPVLVDGARYIYQVHGYGPVTSIPAVYEFAQILDSTKFKGNYASYADLAAATLQPAEWATCTAQGMFRLGGAPRQKISADVVVGATDVASIAKQMFDVAGIAAAKIGSLSQFSTVNWSLYQTEQTDVLEALKAMFYQAGGYLYADGTGVWQVGDYYAPIAAIVINEDRSTFPLVKGIKELNANGPVYKVNVGYDRCWDVHGESDVSPALSIISDKQIANDADTKAAKEAAQQAASDAKVAKDRTDAMVDDGKLDRAEKQQLVQIFASEAAQQTGLQNQTTLVNVTAERATLTTKFANLKNYLEGLSPAYTDTTQDTIIDRATFNARWSDYEIAKQALLNKIAGVASTVANYSGIADDNGKKPADNATVGGTIGKDIKNADGTVYVPPSKDQLVDTVAPGVPTGLAISSKITPAGATIDFAWNAVGDSDLAGYTIAIKQAGGNYVEFNTGSNSYTRDALPRGTSFTAKVSAFDKAGNESGFSAEVTATTAKDDVAPGKPTALAVDAAYNTGFLTWTNPTDADLAQVAIRVYDANTNVIATRNVAAVPGGSGSFTIPSLAKATLYKVNIQAIDTSGNASTYSDTVTFTTACGIDVGDFTPGLSPIKTVTSLPTVAGYTGPSVVFLQSDGKLYRLVGGAWTKEVGGADIANNTIDSTKIVDAAVVGTKIASGTIDTSKLMIADSLNYCENPDFAMGQVGNEYGNSVVESDAGRAYRGTYFCRALGDGVVRNKALMKVNAGDQLYGYAYINQTGFNASGNSYVRFSGVNAAGAEVWANLGQRVTGSTSNYGAGWYQKVTVTDTVPPNAGIVAVRVEVVHYPGNGEVFIGMMGLMRRNGGELIVDGAITAGKIATGAIEADKIASNSIAANKLVIASRPISVTGINIRIDNDNVVRWDNGAITSLVENGDYVTRAINAGAQGWGGWAAPVNFTYQATTNSPNLGIYYTPDVTSGVYGQQIPIATWSAGGKDFVVKSGTATLINGANVVTGSLNADMITARSIGADRIGTGVLTANEIAAGTITATQIATGALTARTIATGNPDSIVPDSNFQDASWWNSNVPDGRLSVSDVAFTYFKRCLNLNPGGGIDVFSSFFPVEPGATYKIMMAADGNIGGGTFQPLIHMPGRMWYSMIDGRGVDPANPSITLSGSFSNTWTTTITNLAGDNNFNQWQFRLMGSWSGNIKFAVRIVRVSDTTLIQDGAITTQKITVNTLNGDRIQAGTLNADKLNANSVLAGSITVGTQGTLNDIAQKAQNATPLTFTQYQGIYTINGNLATKTGGGDQWDYNAWVDTPLRGSFILSGKFPDVSTFIGVRPSKDLATYPGFNHSWHRSADGNWYIFEGGNAVWAATSFASHPFTADTVCRIEYAGNVVNYWADDIIIRSVGATPNTTWWAGFAIARPGSSLRFLTWSGGNDNSLVNTDPAARINQWSSTIDPGKVLIQGQTTLDAWRDQTEIRGGAIRTNSISAEKIAINARGITALGLDFRYQDGRLWWSAGHVLYTDDNGNPSSPYIPEGSVAWAGGSYNYILWDKGAGGFRQVVDGWEQSQVRNSNAVIMVTWRNGSNFVANYGGTIVSGDRIVTRSISAAQIQAGTIGAYEIAAGSITADRLSVGSLSAISANIGTLVSYNGAGGRIERDGNGDRGYYNNGVLGYEAGFLN